MQPANSPTKIVSQRRRLQNQQAQKNYRSRQRSKLQLLESLTRCSDGLPTNPVALSGQPCFTSATQNVFIPEGNSSVNGLDTNNSEDITLSSNVPAETSAANQERKDVVKRVLEEGIIVNPNLARCLLEKGITFKGLVNAGLGAILQEDYSDQSQPRSISNQGIPNVPTLRTDRIVVLQNQVEESSEYLPDIHLNNISIKQMMYVAAMVANALALGTTFDADPDAESQFFLLTTLEEAKLSCSAKFSHLKPDLRPSVSQVLVSHHPYLDFLPFPTFRERTLRLLATDPPMVDEDELCGDMQNGLVCWGSTKGGNDGTGCGAPWDVRSWEAKPWFIKKWWILLGGKEGEIYQQTRWWCEMRGDRFRDPW